MKLTLHTKASKELEEKIKDELDVEDPTEERAQAIINKEAASGTQDS